MSHLFPEYFLQTKSWADFWDSATPSNHRYLYIEDDNFFAYVYEYPWYLGEKFWYIPKGPVSKKSFTKGDYENFYNQIVNEAKKQNLAYVKWDFDENFTNDLEIKNNSELLDFVVKLNSTKTILSKKSLQFLATSTLQIGNLKFNKNSKDAYSLSNLTEFFNSNPNFWAVTNKNTRRCTRKALVADWTISTEKTQENFEKFWKINEETAKRQNFAIQPKEYTQKFFNQAFSRIIILSDKDGPQSVWFGMVSENTLTYVFGGNTKDSFGKFGQYLAHLAALQMCLLENLSFYDFGGYDITKGYGKFKENYKGTIRQFLGPVDIILKSIKFSLINSSINAIKFIQRK